MPRAHWEDGAEIVRNDLNATSKALQRELYDRVILELVQRAENAFFSDSFLCSFSSANQFIIKKGVGFISDAAQVSPEPQKRLLYRSADVTQLISSPDSVNDRIDIVCLIAGVVDELTGSRKFKDATTSVITTQSLVIQKDWEAEILVVDGTPAVTPAAPAIPSGYIKIAEVYVTAVTGIANGAAITDTRSLMPIGSSTTVNTIGFQRLPAGAAKTLLELFTSADQFLKFGYFNYSDFDELGADPAAPGASKVRLYYKGGVWYGRSASGITPLGSGGGGGGGGANWVPVSGLGPVVDNEYDEKVWLFEQGAGQKLTLWSKVPTSYLAGRQIKMKGGFYSPSSADDWKVQATCTLIRKNNDAVTSVANQNVSNSGDIVNAVANRFNEISLDLSTTLGAINSVAVQPGDLIKIEIERIAPSGTEDAADLRFIPSSTEVIFG
jgi:hypothetical protein